MLGALRGISSAAIRFQEPVIGRSAGEHTLRYTTLGSCEQTSATSRMTIMALNTTSRWFRSAQPLAEDSTLCEQRSA
jgi:hypothetical protein